MVSCANVKAKTLTLIMYTKHTGIVGEWADAKVGGGWVGGGGSEQCEDNRTCSGGSFSTGSD